MKRLTYAIGLLLVVQGTAFAACPDGHVLKVVGTPQTDDANMTTQGQTVSMIVVDCSSTACTGAFYNTDNLGGTTNANLVFETGAAADGTSAINLTESSLYFSEGVTFVDDANVSAAILLSCQPR